MVFLVTKSYIHVHVHVPSLLIYNQLCKYMTCRLAHSNQITLQHTYTKSLMLAILIKLWRLYQPTTSQSFSPWFFKQDKRDCESSWSFWFASLLAQEALLTVSLSIYIWENWTLNQQLRYFSFIPFFWLSLAVAVFFLFVVVSGFDSV